MRSIYYILLSPTEICINIQWIFLVFLVQKSYHHRKTISFGYRLDFEVVYHIKLDVEQAIYVSAFGRNVVSPSRILLLTRQRLNFHVSCALSHEL
ncbi:hypothetical protein D3C76_1272230 [compost metagenome]